MVNFLIYFALGVLFGWRAPAAIVAFTEAWKRGLKLRYSLLEALRAALWLPPRDVT